MQYWNSTGKVLEQHQNSTGAVLARASKPHLLFLQPLSSKIIYFPHELQGRIYSFAAPLDQNQKKCLGSEATSAVFATPLYQIEIFFQAKLFFDAPNHEKQTCANTFSLQIANTIALDLKNWQTAGWFFF